MKLLFIEHKGEYDKYTFPYSVYGVKEEYDSYDQIYEIGMLQSRLAKELFYLARSARVKINDFLMNSENRRIERKTDFLRVELHPLNEFNYDFTIGKFAKDFYDQKFGEGTMSAQKMKWIFTSDTFTHVLLYKDKDNTTLGYCPIIMTKKMMHYAYPFYDLSHPSKDLGMGMMLLAIKKAKELALDYVYLGTVYTETSLYKAQFNGFEYFNGCKWDSDIEDLKDTIRNNIYEDPIKEKFTRKEILENAKITVRLT
ncbi:MAG: hypothetical protein Fur003_1210 [Candidatus Dojkabacteria bacterium]